MLSTSELKKIKQTFNDSKEFLLTNSFKALSDINRHRIFQLLSNHDQMAASDIAEALNISRPLTSQHLKILEQTQLFKKKKVGQHKFYRLNRQNSFVLMLLKMTKKFS